MKILGFYHICMQNQWLSIVKEQVEIITKTKLYDATEEIFIGCLGSLEDKNILLKILPRKFKIIFYNKNIHLYEIPTLQYLQDLSKNQEFLAWYIHTKGIFSEKTTNKINVTAWRRMMEYFIIKEWDKCVKIIRQSGCDACGIEIRKTFKKLILPEKPRHHFSGNFWWSKSKYVRTLPNITECWNTNNKNRFIAEAFIGMSPFPRLWSFYNSGADLYEVNIDKNLYENKYIKLI